MWRCFDELFSKRDEGDEFIERNLPYHLPRLQFKMGTKRQSDLLGSATVVESISGAATPPPLKLRIKYQSIAQKLTVDIYEAKNAKEKLKHLLNFAKYLKFVNISYEDSELLIRLFKDLVKKETDNLLRAKSVQLMGEVCQYPGANKLQIAEEILDSLHKEGNHVVISQIFNTLSVTATLISSKTDVLQKILKAALKKLDDTHQDVRCSCLSLVGRICPNEPIKISSGRSVDVLELFSEFSADQDPRVRAVVYQSLLTLHQRNQTLELSVYEKASESLNDDYENVRLAAVKIVWVFSNISPDRMIKHPYSNDEEIKLLDDAFIKICNMVNDISMKVRSEAVGLLGSLHNVSFNVLEQTLDKKLMSRGKKTKSFSERAMEKFRGESSGASQKWSSGKVWGDNDPSKMTIPEDEIKLMNTGSCGVFVRALEDEFMEVRSAGIDSLCELANQNGTFASMSTDFLVDMFNDEIEGVRLNSINSLMKLYEYVDLREDQLDTILESLNDFNQVIRNSVRDLLSHCTLSTQACLYAVVLALLNNLKKYPRDAESIWKCMKNLGLCHPNFVSSLVPGIMITHPYYAVPEPNIDDPSHIAIATLIFNASSKSPSIQSLLPVYAMNHYNYFRDSMPNLIPELKTSISGHSIDVKSQESNYAMMDKFFQSTISRISKLFLNKAYSQRNKIIKSCIDDLQHIKKMHKSFAPAAEFLSMFLQCQKLLQKCRTDRAWTVPAALATNECSSLQNDVKELVTLSYKLEFMFSGLSTENINSLKLIRIIAHSLSILVELRNVNKLNQPKVDLKLWETYLHRLHKFKKHVMSTSTIDNQLKEVLNLQESVEENLSAVSTLVSLLQNFFLTYPIKCDVENRLRQIHVEFIEPRNNLDNPLRFSSGLILGVDVVAKLENIEDISNIYIKIVYPDLKVQIHKPKVSEFQSFTKLKHQLVCKVLLSHQTWTEACVVRLSVVQTYATDIKEELNNCNEIQTSDQIVRSTGNYSEFYKGYLDLCDSVKVFVQPKMISR